MIQNIYNQIFVELETLYAHAVVHNDTNDFKQFQQCVGKLAAIAEILGIKTEQYILHFNLKGQQKEED